MRKVIGVCVAICFFVNNLSFALTPALKLGNLGGETYHQKFLYYAEAGLQKDLLELNDLDEIRNATEIGIVKGAFRKNKRLEKTQRYSPEQTVFNPLEVKSFFNLVEHVGGNIFAVPIVVKKESINVCEKYRLLFSTNYDEKNNGFPVFYCTKEELEKHKASIRRRNALPERIEKDAKNIKQSLSLYGRENEEKIDKKIRDQIKGGFFSEFEGRAGELEWNERYKERETPEKYLPREDLDYIKKEIDKFLKFIGAEINAEEAFKGKNLVLISFVKRKFFPIIEEDEKSFRVTSHASQNAVYKFLTKEKFDLLTQKHDLTKSDVKACLDEIITDFIHEIGVIYDLKWQVSSNRIKNGKKITVNDLDLLLYKWRHDRNGIDEKPERRQYVISQLAKGPKNLDHLSAGDNPRDYANAVELELEDYEKNPRWKTIEEDLKWAKDRDDAVKLRKTKKGWNLTSLKTGEKVTPDEEIGKILNGLEDVYEKLDSWIEAFGTLDDRYFWKEEREKYLILRQGYKAVMTYFDVFKELSGNYSYSGGSDLVEKRFGEQYKENIAPLFKSDTKFKRLQPVIKYYILPLEIQKWIRLRYLEISGKHDVFSMFSKDDNITEKLIECAGDYLKKARKTDIVMVRGSYHASPRTRVPSHVGRGINQKDALFWEGQGFLEAYLVKDESAASEFPFFLFNEAMHVGNSTDVLHGKIEKPEDIGRKIEHMELSRYTELDKNWRKYIFKPWEPMISGVTVGKTDEIISAFSEIKSFAENDFFGTLLIEGAIGTGKTQSREAIEKFMGITEYADKIKRVHVVKCGQLPDDETELSRLFLQGILPRLMEPVDRLLHKRSLLILDELPDASPRVQNFLVGIMSDEGEAYLPSGEKLDLGDNLKIVCYANKTIEDLPDSVFRADLKSRIGQTVKLPDLSKRGEDMVRLAEKFNYDFSEQLGIPWAPIDENLGEMLKNWVEFYARWSCHYTTRKIGMEIQVRTLKNFMKELVLTRKGLLDDLKTKGELRKKGKKLPVEQKVREIFSTDYLTIADVVYANTGQFFERKDYHEETQYFFAEEKEIYKSSKKYYFKKYISGKPLTPYFKELGAFDGEGNPVGLYTGPAGDQPGMTMIREGNEDMGDNLEKKFPDLAKVLNDIPDEYNDYGVDHESLAEALMKAPFAAELRSLETGDVVEYMNKFFKKVFGGKCEVEIKYDESRKNHTTIETDIAVDNLRYVPGEIADSLEQERDAECEKYRFRVVFERTVKKNEESLSVGITFPFEKKPTVHTRFSTGSMVPEKVTDIMQGVAAEMLGDKSLPEGVRNIVAENVIDFSKLDGKSVLIFSKTAVFDKGLGLFLSKLARAGMKIAVVAPEDGQKEAIALLNKKEKVEIVCLDGVEDALNTMPADSYYYFKTKDDPDWGETRGIIQCDITDKIAIIIRALAEANHVTDVNVIEHMEKLADQFRQAV